MEETYETAQGTRPSPPVVQDGAPATEVHQPLSDAPNGSANVNGFTSRSSDSALPSLLKAFQPTALKKPYASALKHTPHDSEDVTPQTPVPLVTLDGVQNPPDGAEIHSAMKKNVQFQGTQDEMEETEDDTSRPPSLHEDKVDSHSKTQSFLSKLRALTSSQINTHARSSSVGSAFDRPATNKDSAAGSSARTARDEEFFPMMVEDTSGTERETDADAEDSAVETAPRLKVPGKRRRARTPDQARSAPNTPQVPRRQGFLSPQITAGPSQPRPRAPTRSATDTDVTARAAMSEDEGRKRHTGAESPWKWKQSRRDGSYGGQRDSTEPSPESKRPTTLRGFANIASHLSTTRGDDAETPKTPRRRGMGERGTTFGARKWKEMQQKLKLIGQGNKKKDRTVDHEKSAELLAELAAGGPAALILASMFQRDEHGARRIPVLLEQLKVRITDSFVDKRGVEDRSAQRERHLIFRIELEYGNGLNRMKWVVNRSLYDFINMHAKYKFYYKTGKFKSRTIDGKRMPKFPKSAFPYSRAFRGMEDEGDEQDDPAQDTDGQATDTEPTTPRTSQRPIVWRNKSSQAAVPASNVATALAMPGLVAGNMATKRAGHDERRRKKLEIYLLQMIKFMLFRPEANRLCRFLEVSALGMRLAAEGSYHGKEGYLVIQSAKGLDFRKALTPANIKGRHTPKWFLVRHSYVVCVDSPEEMHIYDVFLFDSTFSIQYTKRQQLEETARSIAQSAKENARHPKHHRLKLRNSERKIKLIAANERQLAQFEESIKSVISISPWVKENRFDSFAPVRPNCFAQWLVDGRDHMWVVSRAISQAKDVIYIHDWWLSPELYMRRPPAISGKWRLDRLLKRKASEGVKVFVIVYRNIESAVPIDSQYTKFSLLELHPNVFVQRSPNQFRQNTFFWAHHEKLVIVDHTLAFVGGIDLCFGRWDTPQHTLIDDKPTGFEPNELPKDSDHCQLWPGKDYSNPRVQDFYALNKPYEEMYNRNMIARMPWHDISMQVVGQPARDLTRHFVQRWNYILRQRKPTRPTPFLLPPPDFAPADLEGLGLDGTCEVQILRSAGPWSLGTPERIEHSIQNAYIKMIEDSEHFVYIENQFFISSCSTEQSVIQNHIGDALVERIVRAHKNAEAWRAIIIIPLIPGFQNTVDQEGGTSVRLIMQYQYRSICRGDSSIFGRLRAEGIEPSDYIDFYALRQWGKIGPKKAVVTEQLYIHAKCMVVDDRIAIIGSANINERSMLGNRDSECAAVVRDTDMIESRMNGEPYQVGRFPHSLRMRLMREHLGLDVDKIMEDAQVMETEHRKNTNQPIPESVHTHGSEGSPEMSRTISPTFSDLSQVDTLELTKNERAKETNEELLARNDDLRSFNGDADWEQADNPNLKANRKLTEDPRVTGNEAHNRDVAGDGFDHLTDLKRNGYGVGRDSTLVRGEKEVLTSKLNTEGLASMQSPIKRGEEPRMPSYVQKLEVPNPPMPPRPSVDRMNTAALGLPMAGTLPPLPDLDDTDIGGPSLGNLDRVFSDANDEKMQHPLMAELKRPAVDRDCMQDPLHEAFYFGTWHEIAENNTKIYRAVFRCMPDNLVRDWREYHEYVAYEQRFNDLQGLGKSEPGSPTATGTHKGRSNTLGSVTKSGPPGAGLPAPGAELKAVVNKGHALGAEAKEKLGVTISQGLGDSAEKQEKLGEWAADMNRRQVERQSSGRSPTASRGGFNEKFSLGPVAEDQGSAEGSPGSSPTKVESSPRSTAATSTRAPALDPATPNISDALPPSSSEGVGIGIAHTNTTSTLEKVPTPPNTSFVGYSDALNMNVASGSAAQQARRRRRATTAGSKRIGTGGFTASDDILGTEEAEELLNCVQGNLVLWPYDWYVFPHPSHTAGPVFCCPSAFCWRSELSPTGS